MKVVYHCYGGAHASPTAAAIHLGLLQQERLPRFSDFRTIPHFDQITCVEHGKLILIGQDRWGNEVYILGRRTQEPLVIDLIREFVKLEGGDPDEYIFVNCVQLLNPFMVTGGFSSRAMGWVGFGRPLVIFGTMVSYPTLVSIVKKTLRQIQHRKKTECDEDCLLQ